jgi:RNA polymerase sigma-70 factor (ECF subfamily)
VLLERLTPVERAVFLLREVFEYEYSELAGILGQTEANCRQILRRARQHVSAIRPRFQASAEKQSELLERFLHAVGTGDIDGLLQLLASDVVLHSDGGGKAIAVPNLIHGADKVARGILSSMKNLVPKHMIRRLTQINGEAGFITYLDERPFAAITLHVIDNRVQKIFIVTNPEKLAHLPPL